MFTGTQNKHFTFDLQMTVIDMWFACSHTETVLDGPPFGFSGTANGPHPFIPLSCLAGMLKIYAGHARKKCVRRFRLVDSSWLPHSQQHLSLSRSHSLSPKIVTAKARLCVCVRACVRACVCVCVCLSLSLSLPLSLQRLHS